MNEKGFATILGLCLLLALVLVVKGIQESEGNHAYEMTDFQTECDLQNAAEVGIYKAVKIVRDGPNPLPGSEEFPPLRTDTQHKIIEAIIQISYTVQKNIRRCARILYAEYR